MKHTSTNQRGAVSIFIVLFTALLVTIVTTSFVQIMLRNQNQATNNDLSQSAYDSALAGVEDAKRALVAYKKCQRDSSPGGCTNIINAIGDNGDNCDALDEAGVVEFIGGEVEVGNNANQAYTCVKVDVTTETVKGELVLNGAKVIPLDSEGSDDDITGVEISWFSEEDLPTGALPDFGTVAPVNLPPVNDASWPTNRPPIVRAQLIQFERSALQLSDFDADDSDYAKTLFLYPDRAPGGSDSADFASDTRRDGDRNAPVPTTCATDFSGGPYVCKTTIDLPTPLLSDPEIYLQLSPYYGDTHFQLRLIGDDPGEVLDFDGVQPEVDSTGRASDLFRRVKANVSVSIEGVEVPYPPAALSVGNSLCKDFFITDTPSDYDPDTDSVSCDPAN